MITNCYFWEAGCRLQWGDISSWVQGIGSLIAVVIAIWIALRQQAHAIQMEVDKTAYAEKLKIEAIFALYIQVESFLNLAEKQVEQNSWYFTEMRVSLLDPLVVAFENLPLLEIPDARVINQTVLMPIVLKDFQDTWRTFKEKHFLAPVADDELERFEHAYAELKVIVKNGEDACAEKLASI